MNRYYIAETRKRDGNSYPQLAVCIGGEGSYWVPAYFFDTPRRLKSCGFLIQRPLPRIGLTWSPTSVWLKAGSGMPYRTLIERKYLS